jgi:hypothetical protein
MTRSLSLILLTLSLLIQSASAQTRPAQRRGNAPTPPPITAKPEELVTIKEKTDQLRTLIKDLKSTGADPTLLTDVEAYSHAGQMLLEYPDMFTNQAAISHAYATLDQGIERARQLKNNQPQWTKGDRQILAYRSEIDGAVLPYGVILPPNYDPSKPTRLYVWLHGRQNTTTESEFIYGFLRGRGNGNPPVADNGQIQLNCFGRINGAGWHWAGEADVFESIAAIKKRFNIDPRRIVIRGFSQGGEGAWHISLHHPDEFVAAEIGAGTVSRTAEQRSLEPWQLPTLRIWENISQWALNIYNLPLAGHDGENDPGQLESSLRARRQLEKEGFPSVGDPDFLHSQGAPGLWLQSKNTGHGTSPLARQRLDAFLKEWGDKGQSSPDHLRFLTYTTRYNRDYWASLDGLEKHYDRAEIDAQRSPDHKNYDIKTKNLTHLILRETDNANQIKIDNQTPNVSSAPQITLTKSSGAWSIETSPPSGLHKTHALQGPVDDAFLDPFLIVRPTGNPWNQAVHDQSLRTLARFDRLWGRFFRGHPFIKNDTDVTDADIAKYHLVLFGDPGSNKLIAAVNGKLPFTWTQQSISMTNHTYPSTDTYPALVHPNPLNPKKYLVLNTGLTIDDRGYNGDYGTPLYGDYALVKAHEGSPLPDLLTAGLFDESWQLPK